MVKFLSAGSVVEDTSSIVYEFLGDGDGTGDRASVEDFVDHVFFSVDVSVLVDAVDLGSFLGPAAFLGEAVLALDHGGASDSVVVSEGLVGRAGFVGDVVSVDPFVGGSGVSTVAAFIGGLTRDQDLRGDKDIRPFSFPGDLDSVAQST